MELRYKREAMVGALLIFGAVAFVFLLMWLQGISLKKEGQVRVSFNDVGGLREGDPVRTSGVSVGRVLSITLRKPGDVLVAFDLSKGQRPRADASARIVSQDLFGARFIDYNPGTGQTELPDTTILTGQRVEDMSELTTALGAQGKTLLDTLGIAAVAVARELHVTLRSAEALLNNLNAGAQSSLPRVGATLEDLRRSLQRVDLLLQQNGPAIGQTMQNVNRAASNVDSLTRSLNQTSARFDSVLAKVNSGRGPAGALLNDSTLVNELRQTNTALRDLLVDLKANPGRYIRLRL